MAVVLRAISEILLLNGRFCGGCVACVGNLAQKFMAVAKKFDS